MEKGREGLADRPPVERPCPNCGRPTMSSDNFCGSCGRDLREAVNPEADTFAPCPHCGKPMRRGPKVNFCGHCGGPLTSSPSQASPESTGPDKFMRDLQAQYESENAQRRQTRGEADERRKTADPAIKITVAEGDAASMIAQKLRERFGMEPKKPGEVEIIGDSRVVEAGENLVVDLASGSAFEVKAGGRLELKVAQGCAIGKEPGAEAVIIDDQGGNVIGAKKAK